LAGRFNISPFEAGYGWAVKLDKDFFIGKSAMQKTSQDWAMQVSRLRLPGGKGVRPIRPNDAVLDGSGLCIGWVLSCAGAGGDQIALAYVEKAYSQEKIPIGVYYLARSAGQVKEGRRLGVARGEALQADLRGQIVARFAKFQ
jgi:glycine cleavage system aminomethyltransferase T